MKLKVFYGWIIVLACILIAAAAIGFHNTASLFVRPVTEDLGFTRGEFVFFRTIVTILSALLMPFYGRLATRMSLKRLILIGTTFNGLFLAAYSFSTALWHFYLISVLSGLVVNAGTFMMVGILISRWFEDKRGFAIGIALAGSGLGAAIMNPLAGHIIETFGWRYGFRFSGLASIAVLIPTILFLVKDSPESMGLEPYRIQKNQDTPLSEPQGMMLYKARRTPAFWLLGVALLGLAISAGAPNTHTVPYLIDIGFPATTASGVISVSMIVLTVGKIIMGYIFDKFGTITGGIALGIFCILAPVFALLSTINPMAPWFHAVFLGLASTGFSIPVNIYALKFFGQKDFPAILSILSVITAAGAAFSGPVMGLVFDYLGSYQIAWMVLVGFGVLVLVSLTCADLYSRTKKFNEA